MSRGRDVAGLAPSTYQILLHLNIDEGYPVGTFVPLGIGSKLTGQDGAWLYQPLMAFYAAMAALALYVAARRPDRVAARCARSPRSSPPRPRCCTPTPSGAGSRSSPRRR